MASTPGDSPTPTPLDPVRKGSSGGRDLPAAIAVGIALIAIIVVTLRWSHPGFIAFMVVMLVLGAIEVNNALRLIGMESAIAPIVVGTVVIIGGTYAAAVFQPVTTIPWHSVLLGGLAGTIMFALIWRMPGGADGYIKDAAASLFIISYLPLLGSFVGLLLASPHGAAKVVTLALCVAGSDTGGYAVGATLGRHKMAPNISPKKTWEGLAGSVVVGSAVAVAMAVFVLDESWWFGLVLGLACVLFGTAGDLIESLIKRDVGIKDMSSFLPGHGGVMDRMDSILVAAPAVWVVFTLLGTT
ncbi:MAG: phosphatidate cytidylyltransferase [Propionicimonas sp.]|uniref:phosphatidate cytidylyltransferase n=1 Tax=Propionicimonas sp. TaxID=1955623 RepID=UPI002B1EAE4A|nr:phosphatidate cytidylyltransferase [Propionicimonas sp.]MEA4944363.1 phosphatidate cytidylyltransferase [Propionicimonas sp.]MEA5116567.1 phosphatidate cytidylyltransferase [Propionicimonas sp.]